MRVALQVLFVILAMASMVFGALLIATSDLSDHWKYSEPILVEYMTRLQQLLLGIGMVISFFFFVACAISFPWPWVRRKICSHCHENLTREQDEQGFPICGDCEQKVHETELIRKAEEKAAGQPEMKCPADGTLMEKMVLKETEIVIDVCPHCKGAWLEADEITELEEALDQPSGGGSFSSGLILGQALGNMASIGR